MTLLRDDAHLYCTFIAHVRQSDGAEQPLYDHLTGTAAIAKALAAKIGLPLSGELIGLVHDLGKYSTAFQEYLKKSVAYDKYQHLDEDEEAGLLLDSKPKRGSVDHSTAGAIYLNEQFKKLSSSYIQAHSQQKIRRYEGQLLADMLFICVASHHSGLINIVGQNTQPYLSERKNKPEEKTHYTQALEHAQQEQLFAQLGGSFKKDTLKEFQSIVKKIMTDSRATDKQKDFYLGFLTRLLFSCLIDADRSNSIAFEHPNQAHLLDCKRADWQIAIDKVETLYQGFADKAEQSPPNPINEQRNHIAQTCLHAAQSDQGIFTLTVPTGGGKTLASLRFAVQHAKRHNLERIVYIIPFTSIIEQNATEVRKILEEEGSDGIFDGQWVLEQHSNLEPEVQTWQSKLIMDNWNAPIVFTTMVQFLESCFGGGTKGVRRLHQLSRAVLIFDEIQTLPMNCYYLFCSALNFLTTHASATAVLCTATQPVLDNLPIAHNGSLNPATEIIGERAQLHNLFDTLQRVDIHDHTEKPQDLDGLTNYASDNFAKFSSTLVIVNTKVWASQLYQKLSETVPEDELYHLSTSQCARHRKDLLDQIRHRLKQGLPTLVISTQLIEAGVDVSFRSVVRFLAGLDSIAQAAGRCNRHGEMRDDQGASVKGQVFIICPESENLNKLPTIAQGKAIMSNILSQWAHNTYGDVHLLHPDIMQQFFHHYYQTEHGIKEMAYPIKDSRGKSTGTETLYNWLSSNSTNPLTNNNNTQRHQAEQFPQLWQSFMDAGRTFKAIDAPTKAIIVPYLEKGRHLISALCNTSVNDSHFYQLVRDAQQYSINVFAHTFDALFTVGALHTVRDTGIFILSEAFYDAQMGLNLEGTSELDLLAF
ncbi:CRISPR-associated helicase Cas3' [Psychrobacter aestuarii]|uniref:CRISPR-associated helicase/endonuclease Cas3 n=1 Tax=Psychrobacter aestuarii TaxID=556327 RepID=A0ABP3FBM3_9GAMM|nr:CRISPR-associated helicase Cas3' [Psychrobacter aestuarii]